MTAQKRASMQTLAGQRSPRRRKIRMDGGSSVFLPIDQAASDARMASPPPMYDRNYGCPQTPPFSNIPDERVMNSISRHGEVLPATTRLSSGDASAIGANVHLIGLPNASTPCGPSHVYPPTPRNSQDDPYRRTSRSSLSSSLPRPRLWHLVQKIRKQKIVRCIMTLFEVSD